MRAIVPKGELINIRRLKAAITAANRATVAAAKVDFGVTTQTWKSKPAFATQSNLEGGKVWTDDAIYGYVNNGTPPHVIRARGRVLVFQAGGQAKTIPGTIASGTGGAGKSGLVFVKSVNHPGTEARKFDEAIADKWRKEYPTTMQRAIDSALS